jgi:hypothetical protein
VYPDGYIFNGVMGAAVWCSCPAMILLDLLTTERYGFGTHITDSSIDLFSFVTASKFANTLVDDGFGGQEARFSCNVNIQSSSEAFNLINELAGVMRAMPIWSTGTVLLAQDSPKDASYIFSLANVSSDGFNYTGSSLKQRHSVVSVSYFNMDSQEIDFEIFENTSLIAKIGTVVKQVKGFGCTSRGQAQRLAKAISFSEGNESELCTFTTSLEAGLLVRPGAVIEINDPVRAGVRRGGKLSAVTSTTIVTVDDTQHTDLPTTDSPTLTLVLPDGTIETKNISDITNGVVTVSSAFSQTPNVGTMYLIQNTAVQAQKFRVITVEEIDGINYTITALSYINEKYAFIEDGASLPARTVSKLNELKPPPSNLSAVETIVPINNQAVSKIFISWQPIVGVTEYQVNYRYENSNFVSEKVSRPDFQIINSQLGTYEIQVFSYNVQGQLSATSNDLTFEAVGKTALPQDVSNLTVEPVSDQFVRLRFDKATDVDVTHGGNVVVRHSNLTDGTGTFTNSVDIIPALPGNVSETLVPAVDGEYILKFRDDGGRLSSGETSVVVTTPDPQPKLAVFVDREDTDTTPFNGTKTNIFFDGSVLNGLVLGSSTEIDSVASIDALASFDFLGDIASRGTYDFVSNVDFGGKQVVNLTRHMVSESFYPNDLIDSRTALIDVWTDIDALTAFDTNARLLVAQTDLDPDLSVSATYAQSGTTITITKANHGYVAGNVIVVDFTSGTGIDGEYVIQSTGSVNDFVLTGTTSQTTSGNCTYGANFTPFEPMANGTFIARGFKFRAELTSSDPAQSIIIKQLGYSANLIRRTEQPVAAIASGTSRKSVSFINTYFTGTTALSGSTTSHLPTIGIILENMESGDFFSLHNITGSGFDIDVKNGSSFVNRNFRYTAVGFGRGS